jgi:hypothetical protein
MNPVKKFIYRYILGVMMLRQWGERAWPWNVRSIWQFTDFDPAILPKGKKEQSYGG